MLVCSSGGVHRDNIEFLDTLNDHKSLEEAATRQTCMPIDVGAVDLQCLIWTEAVE